MYFLNEPSRRLHARLIHCVSPYAVLIACLWFQRTPHFTRAADGGPGAPSAGRSVPATTQESPVASMARLMDRLSDCAREQSRDGFDYQAVIESVGRDPAKLLMWVKENTRRVPYSGLLRGPQGVLMDRVGNDLDRALLLAQFVNSSGYECRLARANLADDEAAMLIAPAALAPLPGMVGGKPSEAYLAMDAEVEKQTKALMALVTPVVDMAKIGQSLEASRLADAKDHWWLQYNPAGKWIDLDPDSDGKPSSRLGHEKPVVFACATNDLAGKIPAELFHSVTFKVVIERWKDGKLEEEAAIESVVRTIENPANHVVLYHRLDDKKIRSANPPQQTVLSELKEPAAIRTALLNQHGWRPLLVIDGRAKGPKSFDETGTLFAPEGGAQQMGKGVRDVFGNALAGAEKTVSQSVLTAEWMDITLTRPGRPPLKIRREIFDSIGPAARAAAVKGSMPEPVYDEARQIERNGALSGWTDHQIASCIFPFEFLKHQNSRRILDRRVAVLAAMRDPTNPDNRGLLRGVLAGDNLSLYNVSRGIYPHHVMFQDRATVSSCSLRWRVGADGTIIETYSGDLAANAVATTSLSASDAFTEAVRRGVTDTFLEALLVGGSPYGFPEFRPSDTMNVNQPPSNTTEIFSLAAQQGILPVLLKDVSDPGLKSIQIPDDVRQRITMDLTSGNVIVLPVKTVTASDGLRIGWWRIDAATGSTVGVMDTGGCGTGETAIQDGVICEGCEDTVIFNRHINAANTWFRRSEQICKELNLAKGTPEYSKVWSQMYDLCIALVR